jgi:hypothetical protein
MPFTHDGYTADGYTADGYTANSYTASSYTATDFGKAITLHTLDFRPTHDDRKHPGF